MPNEIKIRVMQTADLFIYKDILKFTSDVNIKYCSINGLEYESYIGIKRGIVPWQATYNRIFMLNELLANGFRSWVFYLDADAFIVDLTFDIREYLASVGDYCFIGQCGGAGDTPWDINAGVFFLNLGDPDGRAMVRDWLTKFNALVPEHYLQSPTAEWDEYPNDQALMYECLKMSPRLLRRTKREVREFLNYTNGTFVQQAIRAGFPEWKDRLAWVERQTRRVLDAREQQFPTEIDHPKEAVQIDFELSFRSGGNSPAFVQSGFSVPEPIGTWMTGANSSFEIPCPEHIGPTDAPISVSLIITPAIIPDSFDSQPIEISVNGSVAVSCDISEQTRISFDIPPAEAASGQPLRIDVKHDGFIPASGRPNTETRDLAAWIWSLHARATTTKAPKAAGLGPATVFQIRPRGQMGNRMFQYMIGLGIQARVPGCCLVGAELNEWGINTQTGVSDWAEVLTREVHALDVPGIARRLRAAPGLRVSYDQCGQRLENLLHAQAYADVFPIAHGGDVQWFDERFVVINIRGGDILSGEYPDYTLIPIAFYQQLVEQTGKIPVFIGQLDSNPYTDEIRRTFPNALFLPSRGAIRDFQTIRKSKHIVLAVSTFSWLAGWLSEASTIVMPVTGFYNPEQDHRVDLLPADDGRFRFYKFPVNKAVHVSQVLAQHQALHGSWHEMSADETQALRDRHRWQG